jgi:SAM-dependent methyltransferase
VTDARSPLLWPAFEQFQAFFLRPLLIAASGKGDVARALLNDNISGITYDQFYRNSSCGYRLRHPGAILTNALYRLLEGNIAVKRRLRRSLATVHGEADVRLRRRFLEKQRRQLQRLSFGRGDHDPWQSYYADMGPEIDKDAKIAAVKRLLEESKPTTVLDLGCNTGAFSLLAAQAGARVIAVDGSETCIERLYQSARKSGLQITPIVANLACPAGPGGFMAEQYPGFLQRARSRMVLCLGLMHHLHVTGRQPFARIAELLATLSLRHLVFEYIAPDDDNMALLGAGRPIDYSQYEVEEALRAYFPRVEVFPSDRPTRRLLACSKSTS